MPDRPGSLVASYGVKCGMCKLYTINGVGDGIDGIASTKTQAKVILNRAGWAFTRAWGWICPKCDKFGSSGVVPERGGKDGHQAGELA